MFQGNWYQQPKGVNQVSNRQIYLGLRSAILLSSKSELNISLANRAFSLFQRCWQNQYPCKESVSITNLNSGWIPEITQAAGSISCHPLLLVQFQAFTGVSWCQKKKREGDKKVKKRKEKNWDHTLMKLTKHTNNLSSTSSIIRDRKNMCNTSR